MTIYNNKGVLYTPFVSRCSSGGGWEVISQLGFAVSSGQCLCGKFGHCKEVKIRVNVWTVCRDNN